MDDKTYTLDDEMKEENYGQTEGKDIIIVTDSYRLRRLKPIRNICTIITVAASIISPVFALATKDIFCSDYSRVMQEIYHQMGKIYSGSPTYSKGDCYFMMLNAGFLLAVTAISGAATIGVHHKVKELEKKVAGASEVNELGRMVDDG